MNNIYTRKLMVAVKCLLYTLIAFIVSYVSLTLVSVCVIVIIKLLVDLIKPYNVAMCSSLISITEHILSFCSLVLSIIRSKSVYQSMQKG